MSLSDNERQTIVRMEIGKAHKTFEDMEFLFMECQPWREVMDCF